MATIPTCDHAFQPVLTASGYICESILKSLPMAKLMLIFACVVGAFVGLALVVGFINSSIHFVLLNRHGGPPFWKQLGFICCVCYATGSLFIFIARTDLHSYRSTDKFYFFLFFFGFCKWTYFVAQNLFVLHCIEYSIDRLRVNSNGYTLLTKLVAIVAVIVATAQFIVYLVISFKISSKKIVTDADKELRARWYNAGYSVLMASYGMIFIICSLMFVVVYKFHKKITNYNKELVRTINTVSLWAAITLSCSMLSIIAIAIFQYAPVEITVSLTRKDLVTYQTTFFKDLFMNTVLGFLDFIPAIITLLVFALQGFSWLPLQNIYWSATNSPEFEKWLSATNATSGPKNRTGDSASRGESDTTHSRQNSDVGQRMSALNTQGRSPRSTRNLSAGKDMIEI
jgi:hypothetical protein